MEQQPGHETKDKDAEAVRIRRTRRETAVDFGSGFRILPRFIEPDTADHMKNAVAETQSAMRSVFDHFVDRFTKPRSRRDRDED